MPLWELLTKSFMWVYVSWYYLYVLQQGGVNPLNQKIVFLINHKSWVLWEVDKEEYMNIPEIKVILWLNWQSKAAWIYIRM